MTTTYTERILPWLCFIGLATPATAQTGVEVARGYREANEAAIVRDFAEMLTYPNRARDLADITRAAEHIRDRMRDVGVIARLLSIEGVAPLVFGEVRVAGATRTLGLYAHYDGQPVDPANWTHPPFEPTLYTDALEAGGTPRRLPERDEPVDPAWRLYARSAGDDKAPIEAFLTVLEAFRQGEVTPTSNLVFLFDGQEEAGSRQLGDYMELIRETVDEVDIWLFCDGPAHQSGRPLLAFGARGSMGLEVTVYGATRNLHSGHYGNWAPDTGLILARLLASMKDDAGRVLIDGWYEHGGTARSQRGGGGSVATRTSMSDPFVQQVIAAATEAADRSFAEGALVLSPGLGETLPIALFTDVWQKPAIVVPIANHDNNQHAPDENLRLGNLWYGIELFAEVLTMP